ncbi:enoyl-CoA hydratase/isomerase family protein, partial [Kibdelosporangium lantanae]
PAGGLADRAKELATTIATRSRVSQRGAKEIITAITEGRDEDESIRSLYDDAVHSADYAEGVRAFLEKRPPRF